MKHSTAQHSTAQFFSALILVSSLVLSACHGGGGGSTSTDTNGAPTASSVSITDSNGGTADMGDTLTGSYTYADIDGDNEGASTFRWLRDGTAISGATKSTYNIIASDANAALTFEVIPIAAAGTTTGSAVTSSSITIAAISKPLNDTGITKCGDYAYTDTGAYPITGSGIHNNDLDCSVQATVPTQTTDGYDADGDIIRAGQDALYGRDATNNDNSNGHAGFDFTKLDSSGIALTDQTVAWDSTSGSEAAFSRWSCVKDNVTGLTWEVKAAAGGGLQANDYTYTWYNSTNTNDGGDYGIGDTGVSTTTNYESTPSAAVAGSDNCLTNSRCDTEKYVVDVNASNANAGICGATDWRLPTRHELVSIANNSTSAPAIEANYFPNTLNSYYWSSSPYAGYSSSAWYVFFFNGYVGSYDKSSSFYVRLVRGSN